MHKKDTVAYPEMLTGGGAKSNPGNIDVGVARRGQARGFPSSGNGGPKDVTPGIFFHNLYVVHEF